MDLKQLRMPPRDQLRAALTAAGAVEITEHKTAADGRVSTARCRLLGEVGSGADASVYLYHEVEGDWRVGPLIIGPPVFTIAWYRRETPYNLYTWFHPDGSFVAGYYNAVGPEGYVRAGAELRYRDLIMDLLVHPDGTQELLDEEEAGALASTQYDLARETMDKLTGQAAGRIAGCVAEAREIIASIDGSGT